MLRIIVEPFVNLYAVELPQLRGQRRVDGVRNLISTQAGRDLPALRFVGGGPAPEGRFLRELPDARRAGEAVGSRHAAEALEERAAAFYLEHLSRRLQYFICTCLDVFIT